jgi:hypothetical protein
MDDTPPTNPSRTWLRRLRVGMAMLCLVGCFLTVALWAYSYRYYCTAETALSGSWMFTADSDVDSLGLDMFWGQDGEDTHRAWLQTTAFEATRFRLPSRPDFDWQGLFAFDGLWAEEYCFVEIPYWSLALTFGLLALLLRPPPRLRFGLRELFVVVTLAAITLGLFEVGMRAVGVGRP